MLLWLIKACIDKHLLPRPYEGKIQVFARGYIKIGSNAETLQIHSVALGYRYLLIQLRLENGKLVSIWRDSCCERDYRHLIAVLLNQQHSVHY